MKEKWLTLRNRLLASREFQNFAGRFWPTRPVARRRAGQLFDLTAGFVYSQVLLAWIETGLIELLAEGARNEGAIAQALRVDTSRLRPFLVAGEALGLGERLRDGRWVLGSEGAALRGNPGVVAMVRHHRLLYDDLSDPVALIERGGGNGALAGYWPYATGGEGDAAPYSKLMAASQPMIAEQVLASYDFGKHRRLLDVGGGEGAFLEAVAARHPALELQLFDLPDVAVRAGQRLGSKAEVFAGSFREDALPQGADLVTLVRILHDHDDDAVRDMLARLHAQIAPGATLLVAEPMAGTPGGAGMTAYFSLYLMAMGSGRPRTPREISNLLRAAGFTRAHDHTTPIPLICSVISVRKEKV